MHGEGKVSPLSNWPRYPGGAIAGALIALARVLVFVFDVPWLWYIVPAALVFADVVRMIRSARSHDWRLDSCSCRQTIPATIRSRVRRESRHPSAFLQEEE